MAIYMGGPKMRVSRPREIDGRQQRQHVMLHPAEAACYLPQVLADLAAQGAEAEALQFLKQWGVERRAVNLIYRDARCMLDRELEDPQEVRPEVKQRA